MRQNIYFTGCLFVAVSKRSKSALLSNLNAIRHEMLNFKLPNTKPLFLFDLRTMSKANVTLNLKHWVEHSVWI
jgi:hypothetical protein